MDITLYSFEEALTKLRNKEMPLLIRAKHMNADFINKCILLYSTDRYISLASSCISGKPDQLYLTVLDEETGDRITTTDKFESDDILANDYIDSSEWKLFDTRRAYDEKIRER